MSTMNLNSTRRRFFGFIGGGAVATKIAADAEIARLSGVDVSGFGAGGLGMPGGPPSAGEANSVGSYVPYEKRLIQAGDYLRTFGIPDWMEHQLRDNARYVNALDSDLASKRSWSMSVKVAEQRQRNYQRQIERMHKSAWTMRGRSIVQKLLGFEWPW